MKSTRCFQLLLAGVPPLLLLSALVLWHVEVPYLDQWELVPLLEKADTGALSFSDLWAQHNEHRILIPKLIMLGLARATAWDTRYELAVTYLLALAVFGLLLFALWRASVMTDNAAAGWCVPLLSIIVFSLNQWENWFLGWQLQVLLAALAVLCVLYCLARAPERPVWLAGALLGAVVASSSFGSGVLVWPAGFVALYFMRRERHGKWIMVAWGITGAIFLAIYFHGFDATVGRPDASAQTTLLTYPAYILKYIGAPLVNWDGGRAPLLDLDGALAAVAGGIGLCTWVLLACRMRRSERGVFAFWVTVGLFSLACAITTAYARAGDPLASEQASSSRYVTFGSFLWYSILGFSVCGPSGNTWPLWPRRTLYIVLTVLATVASAHGAYTWSLRYPAYREAECAVLEGRQDAPLHFLYPRPELLGPRIEFLRKNRLSIFATVP